MPAIKHELFTQTKPDKENLPLHCSMWLSACLVNFCRACFSSASFAFSAAVPYAAEQSCASCSSPTTASSLVFELGICVRAGTAGNTRTACY